MSHTVTGRRSDSRQRILDTARGLFSEGSYLGVSMSDIAERLGVTKAALYYHFSSKREIYENVLDQVHADLERILRADDGGLRPAERLRGMIAGYLEFGMREKNLIAAAMTQLSPVEGSVRDFLGGLRDDVLNAFTKVIDEVHTQAERASVLSSRTLAAMLTAMLDGLVLEGSLSDEPIDTDVASRQIVSALGIADT